LKNEKFNDQYKVSFVNQAQAQDVNAVLDATYSPLSPINAALFKEKPKYLYAVLEAKAETTKGKSIIQKYKSTYDAHEPDLIAPHDADTQRTPICVPECLEGSKTPIMLTPLLNHGMFLTLCMSPNLPTQQPVHHHLQ
jgi:hypothetical protein